MAFRKTTTFVADSGNQPPPPPNIPSRMYSSKFRLSVVQKSSKGIPIKDVLFKVVTSMRQADTSITFKDVHGEEVTLSKLDQLDPRTKTNDFGGKNYSKHDGDSLTMTSKITSFQKEKRQQTWQSTIYDDDK